MRECFEESGFLLARGTVGARVARDEGEREKGRREVQGGEVGFGEWVESRKGAVPDLGMVPLFPRSTSFCLPPFPVTLPFSLPLDLKPCLTAARNGVGYSRARG